MISTYRHSVSVIRLSYNWEAVGGERKLLISWVHKRIGLVSLGSESWAVEPLVRPEGRRPLRWEGRTLNNSQLSVHLRKILNKTYRSVGQYGLVQLFNVEGRWAAAIKGIFWERSFVMCWRRCRRLWRSRRCRRSLIRRTLSASQFHLFAYLLHHFWAKAALVNLKEPVE